MLKLRRLIRAAVYIGLFAGIFGVLHAQNTAPKLFKKFSGRVPVFSLNGDNTKFPNPAEIDPSAEDCDNGADDDGDTLIDYNDTDCQTGLGPEALHLKLPFDVLQTVGAFAPARFTGSTDRDGNTLLELLINSTGPGGRKLSYLRTADPNKYDDVTIRAQFLPGAGSDNGGPVALRIQPSSAPTAANKSYYVKVVPGDRVSIQKDSGDGNSVELAGAGAWTSGETITIQEYIAGGTFACYFVEFTAKGTSLTATVSEVDCAAFYTNNNTPINNRTVTLTATDNELKEGYVGLRSDNDLGGDAVDDLSSADLGDPSVQNFEIIDPASPPNPDAPRIAFFGGFSSRMDENLDHNTDPISSNNAHPWNRSLSVISDVALASYLQSLGFKVDIYLTGSFAVADAQGIASMTPEGISESYDLLWVTSSGGGGDTKPYGKRVTIPFIFAEHVAGQADGGAGLYSNPAGGSGNEQRTACDVATRFAATLTGAKERPNPIDTPATGFGTFTLDPATRELSYHIEFSGLSSAENNAHFHKGGPDIAGGVTHELPPGNPKVGSVTFTEEEVADLLAGNAYVNIHSANHGNGEIRGQIQPANLGLSSIRVIPADQGGAPDHPIIRGLANDKSEIPVYNVGEIPLNLPYDHPGSEPAGLGGKGFKTVKEILDALNSGPGATETQFGGYPVSSGAKILGAMVNPCTEEPFFQVNPDLSLASGDNRGHLALIAAEGGTPRYINPPEPAIEPSDCPDLGPDSCFMARTVFYWLSDRQFPYSTTQALSILRRSALWSTGFLDSPNRSDVAFLRGDSNSDGVVDISDAIHTLEFKFSGGSIPTCQDASDSNDDEQVDQSDAIVTLTFLFLGGDDLPPPFNISFQGCGLDFTPRPGPDEIANPDLILSCGSYSFCR